MAIKIHKKTSRRIIPDGYREELLSSNIYKKLDLQQVWRDSMVSEIYIHDAVLLDIGKWVDESLEINPVPEVAGFLLGNTGRLVEDSYWVSLESFVPSREVAKHNPTSIEFGLKPLVQLDLMREKYPHWDIMGWFHTHPGHSPYLSATDLYTHNGFFLHPYQLAIVLDSLTEQFETGVFSRKHNGEVNNVPCQVPWFHWKTWLSE